MKRNYRVVSCDPSQRCICYSTYEKALEAMLQLIEDNGDTFLFDEVDEKCPWITDCIVEEEHAYHIIDISLAERFQERNSSMWYAPSTIKIMEALRTIETFSQYPNCKHLVEEGRQELKEAIKEVIRDNIPDEDEDDGMTSYCVKHY